MKAFRNGFKPAVCLSIGVLLVASGAIAANPKNSHPGAQKSAGPNTKAAPKKTGMPLNVTQSKNCTLTGKIDGKDASMTYRVTVSKVDGGFSGTLSVKDVQGNLSQKFKDMTVKLKPADWTYPEQVPLIAENGNSSFQVNVPKAMTNDPATFGGLCVFSPAGNNPSMGPTLSGSF